MTHATIYQTMLSGVVCDSPEIRVDSHIADIKKYMLRRFTHVPAFRARLICVRPKIKKLYCGLSKIVADKSSFDRVSSSATHLVCPYSLYGSGPGMLPNNHGTFIQCCLISYSADCTGIISAIIMAASIETERNVEFTLRADLP